MSDPARELSHSLETLSLPQRLLDPLALHVLAFQLRIDRAEFAGTLGYPCLQRLVKLKQCSFGGISSRMSPGFRKRTLNDVRQPIEPLLCDVVGRAVLQRLDGNVLT